MKKQKIAIRGLEKFMDKKSWLLHHGEQFQTNTTTYTARIVRNVGEMQKVELFYDSIMLRRTFILSQQLKNQIRKNQHKIPNHETDRIRYCVYNYPKLIPNTIIEDVYEIDLNSAYTHCAYNLGLIDQKLFDKMQKADKITRLKCLGSIATRNVMQLFDDGKPLDIYVKEDATLRKSWFYIVRTIDNILLKFAEMYDNFLFFYVDGIYVQGSSNVESIMSQLNEMLYPCKLQKDITIKVGKQGNLLVTDPDGDERIFYVRKPEFKKWITI